MLRDVFRIKVGKEERAVIYVHGRLTEAGIDELMKICGSTPQPAILDLSQLSSACDEAVAVLRKLRDEGITLRGTPRYIEILIAEAPEGGHEA